MIIEDEIAFGFWVMDMTVPDNDIPPCTVHYTDLGIILLHQN